MKKIIAVAILLGISCSANAEKMYATVGVGSESDLGVGLSVSGGYEVTKVNNIPVAVEVGYQSYGSKSVYSSSISGHALYAAAVGKFDLGNKLAATAKLGLASETVEAVVPGFGFIPDQTVSASETGLLFGAGIEYEFQKNMSVGAEYVSYNGDGVLGARVKFGF